ncbi:unnamed protein product [Schistosoma mattheei]|uniref:Uncharacterized protein n=1 Tax=Schistosoma mattheei TaxID=31246 RepID=A0AA85C352_9TREM|nr:unnamed protein product [Schistosoma mattheei]
MLFAGLKGLTMLENVIKLQLIKCSMLFLSSIVRNVIAVSYPTVDSIVTWSSSSDIVMNQSSYIDQNTCSFRFYHARNPGRLDSDKNKISKLKVRARSHTIGYKVSPLSNQGHPQLNCFST